MSQHDEHPQDAHPHDRDGAETPGDLHEASIDEQVAAAREAEREVQADNPELSGEDRRRDERTEESGQ